MDKSIYFGWTISFLIHLQFLGCSWFIVKMYFHRAYIMPRFSFVIYALPQPKQGQAGWMRAIPRLMTWLTVYIGCDCAAEAICAPRIPRQSCSRWVSLCRVNERANKLVAAGWYSLHIFACPYSSKELPPGENSCGSPITVLPNWFVDVSADLICYT